MGKIRLPGTDAAKVEKINATYTQMCEAHVALNMRFVILLLLCWPLLVGAQFNPPRMPNMQQMGQPQPNFNANTNWMRHNNYFMPYYPGAFSNNRSGSLSSALIDPNANVILLKTKKLYVLPVQVTFSDQAYSSNTGVQQKYADSLTKALHQVLTTVDTAKPKKAPKLGGGLRGKLMPLDSGYALQVPLDANIQPVSAYRSVPREAVLIYASVQFDISEWDHTQKTSLFLDHLVETPSFFVTLYFFDVENHVKTARYTVTCENKKALKPGQQMKISANDIIARVIGVLYPELIYSNHYQFNP